jgi:hypothetical protein
MNAMSAPQDSDLMNTLVRMVVPMRREFGRQLDVRHFLHDLEYAKDVIQQALTSQDPRLQHYASYLAAHHLGPRNATQPSKAPVDAPPTQPMAPAPAAERAAPPAPERANPTAEELRQRVLKKYTTGLR